MSRQHDAPRGKRRTTSNFLVPNATFIAELVAFVLLLWALSKWVIPPVKKAMTDAAGPDRQADQGQPRRRVSGSSRPRRSTARLLEQTKADASRIREEARTEGRAIIAELRQKAQEEADRVRERGEEQLAAEREQVVAALRAELGRLAAELAERIVGESLDGDEARQKPASSTGSWTTSTDSPEDAR